MGRTCSRGQSVGVTLLTASQRPLTLLRLHLLLAADREGALLPGENPKYSYVGPAGRLENQYERIFPQLNIDVAGNADFTLSVILAHDVENQAERMGAILAPVAGQIQQGLRIREWKSSAGLGRGRCRSSSQSRLSRRQ